MRIYKFVYRSEFIWLVFEQRRRADMLEAKSQYLQTCDVFDFVWSLSFSKFNDSLYRMRFNEPNNN